MREYLVVEGGGDVRWVTINRPHDRNSINSAVMVELNQLLDELAGSGPRAVVFTGGGENYFVGGADGVEMMRLGPEEALDFSVRIQAVFDRLEAAPFITVAAINGLCFGGGFEFALACDLRVAAPAARIGLPEVKVGLIPGGGGTQRLPRLVGIGRALEMILGGRLYKAPEAAALGLVHAAVGEGELRSGVEKLLAGVLRQPQYALSLAKTAVYASRGRAGAEGLAVERERFSRCFEQKFFADLMRQQLREGLLETSADVSDITGEKSR
ncbi:MAG: enoyl-CoA hydratase/isomerase family protein [Pseudomonadota bacterium]